MIKDVTNKYKEMDFRLYCGHTMIVVNNTWLYLFMEWNFHTPMDSQGRPVMGWNHSLHYWTIGVLTKLQNFTIKLFGSHAAAFLLFVQGLKLMPESVRINDNTATSTYVLRKPYTSVFMKQNFSAILFKSILLCWIWSVSSSSFSSP